MNLEIVNKRVVAPYDLPLLAGYFRALDDDTEKYFSYFAKRPFTVIEDHFVTLLFMLGDEPVVYGHLDRHTDPQRAWLGICVKTEFQSMGLGSVMIDELISHAKMQKIGCIELSVLKDNIRAINLYKKKQFIVYNEDEKNIYMKMELLYG